MCEEAARALIDRMQRNEAFRARLELVQDPQERLALVKAEGYEVTAEELQAYGYAEAVDDAVLRDVVGGLPFSPERAPDRLR
jgi:predicted ribosomally synthesized peptide with nif11-like leader